MELIRETASKRYFTHGEFLFFDYSYGLRYSKPVYIHGKRYTGMLLKCSHEAGYAHPRFPGDFGEIDLCRIVFVDIIDGSVYPV